MQVFNLPYKIAGLQYCKRQLVGRVVYDASTGEKRVRGDNKRLSDSLTLMGRGQSGDTAHQLPPAVLECPEVASALKARTLRVLRFDAEKSQEQFEALNAAALKKAKAKEATANFLKNKAERKAAAAMARAAAVAAAPAGPTKAELAAQAAEEKRLTEEQAAAAAAKTDRPSRRGRNK